MRGSFIRIKNALITAGPVGAGISNPSKVAGVGSNPGAVQRKKEKKDNRETPGSHDLGQARPPLECQKFRAKTLATRGVSSLKTPCYLAPQ